MRFCATARVCFDGASFDAAARPSRLSAFNVAWERVLFARYPASHGCVRMPKDLAAEFFARVQIGTPVKVVGSARNVTRVRKAIPIIQHGN